MRLITRLITRLIARRRAARWLSAVIADDRAYIAANTADSS